MLAEPTLEAIPEPAKEEETPAVIEPVSEPVKEEEKLPAAAEETPAVVEEKSDLVSVPDPVNEETAPVSEPVKEDAVPISEPLKEESVPEPTPVVEETPAVKEEESAPASTEGTSSSGFHGLVVCLSPLTKSSLHTSWRVSSDTL